MSEENNEDYGNEDFDDASFNDQPVEKVSPQDLKFAAEIAAHLEFNLNVDLKSIKVSARGGFVHLQGSVTSSELKKEIEENLKALPWVLGLENYLRVV